ncbi:MAG: carboxypeptidase regulatory-like domain-containing protein [Planctomycetes bacterium]|nr:carboxypeptidase regulatory-like domain-containing protein [Planctomycetota bacterium]
MKESRTVSTGSMPSRGRLALAAASCLLLGPSLLPGQTTEVTITLLPEWNLVSVPLPPVDPSPTAVFAKLIAARRLKVVWGYAPGQGWTWHVLPEPFAGFNTLTELVAGRGYFVQLTRDPLGAAVPVTYQAKLETVGGCMQSGWNLAGFEVEAPTALEDVLGVHARRVTDVFRFDPVTQAFERCALGGACTDVERGRGYWMQADLDFCLPRALAVVLEADVDIPPLQGAGNIAGDEDTDYNRNGFLEGALHQDTISFERSVQERLFIVRGGGASAISFTIEEAGHWRAPLSGSSPLYPPVIQGPDGELLSAGWVPAGEGAISWLQLSIARGSLPFTHEETRTVFYDQEVRVLADRGGLGIGHYLGRLHVRSTGGTRTIFAAMTVPPLTGDYEGVVDVSTVNGLANSLGSVALRVSLVEDEDGLRAVIDSRDSPVVPQDVPLSGSFFEPAGGKLVVTGSMSLPAKARADSKTEEESVREATQPGWVPPENPFLRRIVRDFTFLGEHRGAGAIEGTYGETILNLLPYPVVLEGRFRMERRRLDLPREVCGNGEDDDGDQKTDEEDCSPPGLLEARRFNIEGRVLALDGTGPPSPLEGAEVVLTGSHLQLASTAAAGGTYGFYGLPPGVYGASAALLGYAAGPAARRLFRLGLDGAVESLDSRPGEPLELILERRSAPPGELQILAVPESGRAPLRVRFAAAAPAGASSFAWRFPGGSPDSFEGERPPAVLYASPGVHTAELRVTAGGQDLAASKVVPVGPAGGVQNPDGTWSVVDGSAIPSQIEALAIMPGMAAGAVSRDDTAPGAGNARYLLIGNAGAPLNGYMTGGRGLAGRTGQDHLILEVGPVSNVPLEVAR